MDKKTAQNSLWKFRQGIKSSSRNFFWTIHRKWKKLWRSVFSFSSSNLHTFAILCVKKTEYCDMSILQANSLHLYNPLHSFVIYTDKICGDYFEKNRNKFDYPLQIIIKNVFENMTNPWQYYKMEMIIEGSKENQIIIDADTIWHSDPIIDRESIFLLSASNVFKDRPNEAKLITEAFKQPEWLSYTHFVSAFVAIPAHLMSEKLMHDCRSNLKTILDNPLAFISEQEERNELHRLAEEIALCLALQSKYPGKILAFKSDGNRKNRHILQPMYYGSQNRIMN